MNHIGLPAMLLKCLIGEFIMIIFVSYAGVQVV